MVDDLFPGVGKMVKPTSTKDPRVKPLIDWWWTEFESVMGYPYSKICPSKTDLAIHHKELKALLKIADPEEIQKVAAAHLRRETGDEWVDEHIPPTMRSLYKFWGKLFPAVNNEGRYKPLDAWDVRL